MGPSSNEDHEATNQNPEPNPHPTSNGSTAGKVKAGVSEISRKVEGLHIPKDGNGGESQGVL